MTLIWGKKKKRAPYIPVLVDGRKRPHSAEHREAIILALARPEVREKMAASGRRRWNRSRGDRGRYSLRNT
jgi:hypothetical protein